MHISEQIPMKRAFMRPVATCAELLKVIEATFRRRHAVMAETASFFVKMTTTDLVAIFLPWKLKLQSSARLEGRASSLLNHRSGGIYPRQHREPLLYAKDSYRASVERLLRVADT